MITCLTLLIAAPHAAQASDEKLKLIDAAELQFLAGRGQSAKDGVDADNWAYGAGFHLSMFSQQTMLNGWTGVEFMLRMGMMDGFFLDARVVAPWSIYHDEHVELAAGLGGKMYGARIGVDGNGYMTPTASARLGLGFGPIELRVEYDYLAMVGGHDASAFIPLVGGLGVGIHVAAFSETDKDYQQFSMDALMFYRF